MRSASRTAAPPKSNPVDEPVSLAVAGPNIFQDAGLPDPDLLLAEATLKIAIYKRIKQLKLTKAGAAAVLGIDAAEAAALMRLEAEDYTFDRLFKFLNHLGHEVVITVRPAGVGITAAETRVE